MLPTKNPIRTRSMSICNFIPSQYEAQEAAEIWLFLETCCYSLCKMWEREVLLGGITAVINHHGQGDLGCWRTAGLSARPVGTNELEKKKNPTPPPQFLLHLWHFQLQTGIERKPQIFSCKVEDIKKKPNRTIKYNKFLEILPTHKGQRCS